MREELKETVHIEHLAHGNMMRITREVVFWPGMSAEINQMGGAFDSCHDLRSAKRKETIQ